MSKGFFRLYERIQTIRDRKSKAHKANEQKASLWEKLNVIFTAAATVVIAAATIATVCVTIHHARIFSNQLDIMKQTLTLTHRPWVTFELVEAKKPMTFSPESNAWESVISAVISNVGPSPAFYVWPNGMAIEGVIDEQQREKVCGLNPGLGLPIFPKDRFPPFEIPISLKRNTKDSPTVSSVTAVVLLCVRYKFPFDQSVFHKTAFFYNLWPNGRMDRVPTVVTFAD